jgi:Transglycosylase SLT domain
VLVLYPPASSAAAEAPSGSGSAPAQASQPAETGSSTTTAPTETAPTLTVEPATTPPPASPPPAVPSRPSGAQPSAVPQVSTQHAQRRTRGTSGGGRHEQVQRGAAPGAKATPAPARNGPLAPLPSALTPPLPLAFSTSLGGIPTFFIESFRVPPFLLPIYQAAGTAYGVPWQVLAAINEVETDYGRDLSVSSAGAEGWMQFLPSSWAIYGVDANGDGFKDPYNPADAIFAAARYLRAAGAATSLRGAIFAYNHSPAYVESVLLRARLLGGTPSELLGALTGLTQARFPVHAPSHFSDGFPQAPAGSGATQAIPATTIYSQAGAPVIAVQDGLVSGIGRSRELGRFISLQDAYGNTYTYAQLGSIARVYPVLEPHEAASSRAGAAGSAEAGEPRPAAPASAGVQPRASAAPAEGAAIAGLAPAAGLAAPGAGPGAAPSAPGGTAAAPAAGAPATPAAFRAGPNDVYLHPLRAGVRVIAGTVLGHVGAGAGEGGARMLFQIRPNGPGAPLIDPKPILDGWVQLENTSIYRAGGANPFLATEPSPGQALLESKQQLEQQVLANKGIAAGRCGREDVQAGRVDRRVLATLEFLAVSSLKPTVSGLRCAAAAGRASSVAQSEQTIEIVAINGVSIGTRHGRESITASTIAKLRGLQGTMKPTALAARGGGVEVSFAQPVAHARVAGAFSATISPTQWIQLIARLGEIPSPTVRSGPSAASIPDHPGAPSATLGGAHGNG